MRRRAPCCRRPESSVALSPATSFSSKSRSARSRRRPTIGSPSRPSSSRTDTTLDHQRCLAAHNLSEPEERILVETSNSRGRAFARLATEINGRTKFDIDLNGVVEEKTQSEILSLLYESNRKLREKAAASITRSLRNNAHACTFIYNTLLHEKDVLDRLRSYESPEASRHLDNELAAEVVDTVCDVCVENFDIVADYYRLKRRLLDIDELTHCDRYAPLPGGQTRIEFGRAR